ncbi:radical SAM protein [Candidatus Micrarchaeota archaeon]|jgi:molybdenum cofactor biosynthesis enzyme MoaA|nr:radical SAM protein [Candidatus Micrarchaeota archaeon]
MIHPQKLIVPKIPKKNNISSELPLPYVTIAVNNKCNFACEYCPNKGEAYNSSPHREFNTEDLKQMIDILEKLGIEKIRLTGGEPLLMDNLEEILTHCEGKNIEIYIDTNGSLIKERIEVLKKLKGLKIRVSLDTLEKDEFNGICRTYKFDDVIEGIDLAVENGLIERINCVVTKRNINQVPLLIDFCRARKIDLKFLDLYSEKEKNKYWEQYYVDMTTVYEMFKDQIVSIEQDRYTLTYGMPMNNYNLGDITVIIKDSKYGTRYSYEICGQCNCFPCQEGLYSPILSPDYHIMPCRFGKEFQVPITVENFEVEIQKMIRIFANAKLSNEFWKNKTNEVK